VNDRGQRPHATQVSGRRNGLGKRRVCEFDECASSATDRRASMLDLSERRGSRRAYHAASPRRVRTIPRTGSNSIALSGIRAELPTVVLPAFSGSLRARTATATAAPLENARKIPYLAGIGPQRKAPAFVVVCRAVGQSERSSHVGTSQRRSLVFVRTEFSGCTRTASWVAPGSAAGSNRDRRIFLPGMSGYSAITPVWSSGADARKKIRPRQRYRQISGPRRVCRG